MGGDNGVYLTVSKTISRRDDAWNLSGGSKNSSTPIGSNEVAFFNGVSEMPIEEQMKWYDVWGTEQTYNRMAAGWSWSFNTPFTWFSSKTPRSSAAFASAWPSPGPAISRTRARSASSFATSLISSPPFLEVCGISAHESVDGIKQSPIEGTSLA